MKEKLRRYLKPGLLVVGLLILGYFGLQAVQLRMNPPVWQEPAEAVGEAQLAEARLAFEKARTVWNNQFARKGFFALIGLFLALVGALPKKKIWVPKIAFSSGLVALIIHHLLADGKIASIAAEGLSIAVFWVVMAFVVKGTGMGCTVWRWKVLLEGQGFKIPLRHLIESFLIGRFIGSFAPGTSGLDGYRAYDISRYTGKVARSISVIFVEKLIGFFVLGSLLLISVPLGGRLFAEMNVNTAAIAMMGLAFFGMMLLSLVILFKPGLIRWLVDKFIPAGSPLRRPFDKALNAVTAYEKRKLHLAKATLIGFGVHICTIGMYFCTARAIGQFPASSDLFVTSALMIGATILPLSIAGIGMREGVFAFFLGPVAAIYAFGGYLVGELISLLGGPVWLARRGDYYEVMKAQRDEINRDVEDDEDVAVEEAAEEKPAGPLPNLVDYTVLGAASGLLAGVAVAVVDGIRLWLISGGGLDWSLPGYGGLLYGPFLALLGAAFGFGLALLGRIARVPAAPPVRTVTFVGFSLAYVFMLAIGYFYLKRDVFGEKAGLFDPKMLGSFLGFAAVLGGILLGKSVVLRKRLGAVTNTRKFSLALALMFVALQTILLALWLFAPGGAGAGQATLGPAPTSSRPNVVLVMVDTLRADHVGVYGDPRNLTPNLDALARDGAVYKNAYAQASWTRPSVATILTGRYPSSHTSTLKGSILPDEVVSLPEVLVEGGYETLGIASNYNLTPFFNYDQGFVDYRYLSPNLPFGSTDAQAKLIFIEVAKKIQARLRGKRETPADYYVIGEEVTRVTLEKIDGRSRKERPFFMFVTYMDPHDPYFRHPFDGYGISQRAHRHPTPEMIPEMKELYAGEIRYWDETFGTLVDGLKQRGLYDDTLIVLVSDHGEEFGDHGGYWHGTTLYDEQLHVPYIVKFPSSMGIAGGARLDEWTGLVDVAPRIIDDAGLKIPETMQGMVRHASPREPVYAEEDHEGNVLHSVLYPGADGGAWKLIQSNEGNPRGLEPMELYRMDLDPAEKENLAESEGDQLMAGVRQLEASKTMASTGAARAQTGELSPEAVEQLKKLGYIHE